MATLTWINTSGGDWNTASNWSGDAVPTAADDVVINGTGTLEVTISSLAPVQSLELDNPNATLDISGTGSGPGTGTLALSGTVSLETGTLLLAGGTLDGGALAFNVGTLASTFIDPGTLDGIVLQGSETISLIGVVPGGYPDSAGLIIEDGLTLEGSDGTGPGNFTFTAAQIQFDSDQSVAGGTIDLAGSSYPASINSSSGTLTIAANAVVSVTGGDNEIGGNVVNDGLIAIAAGHSLPLGFAGTIVNNGTLNAGPGSTLELQGGFANDGTVIDAGATIQVTSPVSSAALAPLIGAGVTVKVASNGTIVNTGAVLNLGSGGIASLILDGGSILGGTLDFQSGASLSARDYDGELASVVLQGAETLTGGGANFDIRSGISLQGSGGTGPGALTLADQRLVFFGDGAVAGGTISLAGGLFTGPAQITTETGTLTIAANAALNATGASNSIAGNLANDGLINVAAGGFLYLGDNLVDYGTFLPGGNVVNDGIIDIGAGANLELYSGSTLENDGTILVEQGATFTQNGSVFGTGTVDYVGGTTLATIVVDSSVSTAEIIGIGPGTTLDVESGGTIVNTGAVLNLGSGGIANLVLQGGTIVGGTIVDNGSGLVIDGGGTLDGVAYVGTLAVSGQLGIEGDATFAGIGGGRGGIDVASDREIVLPSRHQTLDNVNIQLGGEIYDYSYDGVSFSLGTLTLGSNASIIETTSEGYVYSSLVSNGTISASQPGGEIVTQGLVNNGLITVADGAIMGVNGSFQNGGSVSVTNGGDLYLGYPDASVTNTGHISETNATLIFYGTTTLGLLNSISRSGGLVRIGGTLDLGGGTLDVGAGSALGQLDDNKLISGGTIHDSGAGLVFLGELSTLGLGGTLSAVTYEGTVNLVPARSTLTVRNGLTVTGANGTGSGIINVLGNSSCLEFVGSQTIDNVTINVGDAFDATNLSVSTEAGGPAVLTLGAHANITQWSARASIDLGTTYDAGLVNDGVIGAVAQNGAMVIQDGTFTNNGVLLVANGETLNLQPGVLGNLSAATLSGGNWQVLAGSTLDLGYDNRVAALNASLYLGGPGATVQTFDSATGHETTLDQMLQTVGTEGDLVLANGATFDQASVVQDLGHIVLAGGTLEAAPLGLFPNSDLSGAGTIVGAVFDSGIVLAQGGNLVLDGPLYPGGVEGAAWINVGATLTAGSALAVPVWFVGSQGELVLEQANAQVGPISGFTGDDVIDLANVGTAGLSLDFSGGVLTVRTGGNVDATLRFSGFNGSFTAASDGHGGTLIKDPPLSFNSATLTPGDLGGTGGTGGGGGTAGGLGGTIAVPSVVGMAIGTDQTQGGAMAMLNVGH